MINKEGAKELYLGWHERLAHSHSVPLFERIQAHIDRLTSGDRVIFYSLVALVAATSIYGLYALERQLLVEVPAYGGSLNEGVVGSPQFINPILAISDVDRDLSSLVYAGLMGISGTGELIPVLAESYSESEDGKTYTFVLRSNAKFSDGTPVTTDDVAFTIAKAQTAALKSPRYADWSGVSTTKVDAHTIRFTLSKPYAPFLGLTTIGILPSRLWKNVSNEEFPFSSLQINPVGAGPFKVANVSRDASNLVKSIKLIKNQYYVFGRPYLDSIRFNLYSRSEDLAKDLANGVIESAYDVSAKGALTSPYARVFGVFWNSNDKQVYSRAEVRKALSLALNRQNIVETALGGYATPIIGPLPPGKNILNTPVASADSATASAAKVLQAAGWKYDGEERIWKNASAKQTLDRITLRTSNVPELKNVAGAVKKDWEQLGIPVDIELYEPGDLSQNVIRPRKYEALLYGIVTGRDQDLYAFWHSQERNDPGLNIALYANKTVDALLEEVRGSSDDETRARNLQKIEDLIAADYPAAFIYAPDFIYSVPKDLHGVTLPQIMTSADRFATVASWYRKTDAVWPYFTN